MTEILFALGLGDRIIGVTKFCDYPEEAKKKPKVGGMSNPSIEAVVSLKPDIVVITTDGNPKEFEERLCSLGMKIYVFRTRRLHELPQGIRDLGLALGVKEKAETLAKGIEGTIDKLAVSSEQLIVSKNSKVKDSRLSTIDYRLTTQKNKVLFIIWPEPLIVAGPGTAIDDAITLLGGENIASSAKPSYPKYSVEEIVHQSPDVIIIGEGHADMNMKEISSRLIKRLKSVPAVKNKKVCYMSDNLYRLGPRIIKGMEELSECLKK